jgi:hypothetical protein
MVKEVLRVKESSRASGTLYSLEQRVKVLVDRSSQCPAHFYCRGCVPHAGKLGLGGPLMICVKLKPSASTVQSPACRWRKSGDPSKTSFKPSGDHLAWSKAAIPVFLMTSFRPSLAYGWRRPGFIICWV